MRLYTSSWLLEGTRNTSSDASPSPPERCGARSRYSLRASYCSRNTTAGSFGRVAWVSRWAVQCDEKICSSAP